MSNSHVTHLSVEEVEKLTGIDRARPKEQRRLLKKNRIHCFVNNQNLLIVHPVWISDAHKPVPRSAYATLSSAAQLPDISAVPRKAPDRSFCHPNFAWENKRGAK